MSNPSKKTALLALGAHPDDIEIHAGGSIARLAATGQVVVMADATRGECSSNGTPDQRQKEGLQAAQILGIDHRLNLGHPDTGLSQVNQSLTDELVSLFRQWQPAVVLAPDPNSRHPDHRALAQCARDAQFLCGLVKVMPQLPPIIRPRLIYYAENEVAKPDFLIDVSSTWETKIRALHCHSSQFEGNTDSIPTRLNSGYLDILTHRARLWGSTIGVEHAEGFLSDRPIQLNSLLS